MTETDRDDITAAMVGVIDRYCGMEPIDMPLARELSAEVCRIIEARERGRAVLPVLRPVWLGVEALGAPDQMEESTRDRRC